MSLNYEVDAAYVQEVLNVFGTTDADGNGFIDEQEFPQLAKQLNIEDTLRRLGSADTEMNGHTLAQDEAATRVQSAWRGKSARTEAAAKKQQLQQQQSTAGRSSSHKSEAGAALHILRSILTNRF